ncbi:MAG: SH3 domain-containing protein [Candidatus Aminicenantales bacterium]
MKILVRGCALFLLVGALALTAAGAVILKIKVTSANLWTKPDLNSQVGGLLNSGLIMESGQKTGSFYAVRLTEEGKATISGFLNEGAVEVVCTTEGPAAVPLAEARILRVKLPSANVWAEADPNSRVIDRLTNGQLLEVLQRGYAFLEIIHITAGGRAIEGYVHRDAVEGVCRGEELAATLPTAVLTVRLPRANVWSEPDINSPILGELRSGDRIEVVRKVRTYYEVRFRAKSGTLTGYVQETALAEIGEEPVLSARRRRAAALSPGGPLLFELGAYYSALNGYSRGPLDSWWINLTGKKAGQGSAAFFMLEGAAYYPVWTNKLYVGAAASFHIPLRHAIWGKEMTLAGQQEIVLMPGLLSLSAPVRYFPLLSRAFSITAVPSLLFGWVSGTYLHTDAEGLPKENFSPRMKLGVGIAAGAEYAFLKNLAVALRAGFRALTVDLVRETTKLKETTVDLGGASLVFGLVFRF